MVSALNVFLFIMIVSFVVDRVVKGILFVLSFFGSRIDWLGDADDIQDESRRLIARRTQKVTYSGLAAVLAALFVWKFPDIRVLRLLIGDTPEASLDVFLTWMTILGGSDFVGRILAVSGLAGVGGGPATGGASSPIEVTGKLVLENSDIGKISTDNEQGAGGT